MIKFSKIVRDLKEYLFGKEQKKSHTLPAEPLPMVATPPKLDSSKIHSPPKTEIPTPNSESRTSVPSAPRQPYFVQVGFDFGTSFSKCVCRDVMTERAWVHIPPKCAQEELPFLIPSALVVKDEFISIVQSPACHYPENGLYHLKHALVKTALEQWSDTVLDPYRSAIGSEEPDRLGPFVVSCAVYYLAGALGEVRSQIRSRIQGFGSTPEDYMAVNMAVPVADAEHPEVNVLFHRILCEAWMLADKITGHPTIRLSDLASLRSTHNHKVTPSVAEACYIYPEVSANVQGFVRSRVSSPGFYLFSDTGAGTVDQSIFIFSRLDNGEFLTYLHGHVLPLGSSQIEQRAALCTGRVDCHTLEYWRVLKEQNGMRPELREAQDWIASKLSQGTEATLAHAKQKLFVRDQLNDTRVIFGGGGHCAHPYKSAVISPFSGQLFRKSFVPDVVSQPPPHDLELSDAEIRWMGRLSVAYGLSFPKNDLAGFIFPGDVPPPDPGAPVLPGRKVIPDAPTKDQC